MAIGSVEKTELLAVFIWMSWSTQWTYWQVFSLLRDIEVDSVWMEAVQIMSASKGSARARRNLQGDNESCHDGQMMGATKAGDVEGLRSIPKARNKGTLGGC